MRRMMSDKMRFSILQHASGNFLTDELPDNWEELGEDEQHEFIMDHVWEPMEGYFPSQVVEIIENTAGCLTKFLVDHSLIKEDG